MKIELYNTDHLLADNFLISIRNTEGKLNSLSRLSFSEISERLLAERRKKIQPKLEKYQQERDIIRHQLLFEYSLRFSSVSGSVLSNTSKNVERVNVLELKASILDQLVEM